MNQKISIWIIIILLITNIGLLGLLWSDHYRKPLPPPLHENEQSKAERDEFFAEQLNLNKAQNDSVLILKELHFKQMGSVKFEIYDLSKELMSELFKNNPDSLQVRILSDKIGYLHSRNKRLIYEHFSFIKQLCRPEQYDLLEKLVYDLIDSRKPKQPQPPKKETP